MDEDEGEEYLPPEDPEKPDKNKNSKPSSESKNNIPLSKLSSKKLSEDSDDLPLSELCECEEENVLLSVLQRQASLGKPNKSFRRFKCKLCVVVKHSQNYLNNHHKESHRKLNCPDCDEIFETPSGLH